MEEVPNGKKPRLDQRLKQWARELKQDIIVIYFAMKHPQTPLYTKVLAAIAVGYALSPIDFIPDFVPVLGYLDEVILLPLCIALVIRFIPAHVLADCREEAENNPLTTKPKVWIAAYFIVLIWMIILVALFNWI